MVKEYILSLACAGIASGIIGLFSDSSSTSKYIKLVVSLCFISSLLPGTAKLVNNLPEAFGPDIHDSTAFENAHEKYLDYVIEDTRKKLSTKLCNLIFEKTGIIPEGTDIQLDVTENEDGINVDIASVEIVSAELAGKPEIAEYVQKLTGKKPVMLSERRESN